ncbi:MAG: type II toxin-antitoxin system RelE/ParE family toxin [Desulfobacterales bacterium]|nr:type II toxin-antitoxin system RelE/ParE family toxin [Desulfobacterales bacterium]
MISIVFDPDAKADFLAAVQYYESCQSGLGRRFKLIVQSALQKVAETPFQYRLIHIPFRRYLLPKFPYAIIFSIEPDQIRIIAVAHTKRKPGYWLRRASD